MWPVFTFFFISFDYSAKDWLSSFAEPFPGPSLATSATVTLVEYNQMEVAQPLQPEYSSRLCPTPRIFQTHAWYCLIILVTVYSTLIHFVQMAAAPVFLGQTSICMMCSFHRDILLVQSYWVMKWLVWWYHQPLIKFHGTGTSCSNVKKAFLGTLSQILPTCWNLHSWLCHIVAFILVAVQLLLTPQTHECKTDIEKLWCEDQHLQWFKAIDSKTATPCNKLHGFCKTNSARSWSELGTKKWV